MPRPSSRRGDDALPDEPEGMVGRGKTHRKCSSLRQWLLEGLNQPEPSLYRSRSLPAGYSFRFVVSLKRILLCHDNGVVVADTPEVLEPSCHGAHHLSFLYGPLDIFGLDFFRTSAKLLETEPSNTVGMAGCIPVLVPPPEISGTCDDFALARDLDPQSLDLAASARGHGHGHAPRRRSQVPAAAPRRPKGSGMEVCLEQANSKAFAHLLQRNATDEQISKKTLSDGATTPLIYALDRLRKTPWDCSKGLMALNSMIVRLIEQRADLNVVVPPDRESPLQLLLRASHPQGELVNLCKSRLAVMMLQRKADVNHVDRHGESPLSEAAMAGDVEMCRLLLDHGANVSSLKSSEAAGSRGTADLRDLALDRKVQVLLRDAATRQSQKLSDLVSLGRAHLSAKSCSRAQLCFLQALKIDPLNCELLLAAAEAEFVAQNFEKAYSDASKVVALCPLKGSAYELCARSLWHLNRWEEALCVCRVLMPQEAEENQLVMKLEERIMRHSSGLDAVQAMLAEDSNQQNLWLVEKCFKDLDGLLGDLDDAERSSAWGSRMRMALVQVCLFPQPLRSGWAQRALSETRQLRKEKPTDADVLYWHGRALLHGSCRQDALNALSCASELSSSRAAQLLRSLQAAEQQLAAGQQAAAQGQWRVALEHYAEAEKESIFDPELLATTLTASALAQLSLGQAPMAVEQLTRALSLGPASAKQYYWRARGNMELEQYQHAARDFDAAVDLDPKVHPNVEEERARAHRWSQSPPVPDHYEALGVKKDASSAQVKKAYRLAALRWHPDKNVGRESMAEQAFKQIQEAFEVLSDEGRRRDYDQNPGDRKAFQFGKGAA